MVIQISGFVKVDLSPQQSEESEETLSSYLQEKKYWEVSSLKIQELAKTLKTPHAIYDYVSKQLTYDFSRVSAQKDRLGASAVLQNPSSAVCLEFTDLFIAIARAAGIPAREVDGFAYTDNSRQRPLSLVQDILHAWPEYYDRDLKTWIMIDPTWSNTTGGIDYFNTLDFDHLAFVIKGHDSMYPIPAGGYKLPNAADTKDVTVEYSQEPLNNVSNVEVTSNFSRNIFPWLPIKGTIVIKNNGPLEMQSDSVTIENSYLTPYLQQLTVGSIPPYGFKTISINFKNSDILTNKPVPVTIHLGQKIIHQTIPVSSFVFDTKFVYGGIIIGIIFAIIVLIVAVKAWSVPLSKS